MSFRIIWSFHITLVVNCLTMPYFNLQRIYKQKHKFQDDDDAGAAKTDDD